MLKGFVFGKNPKNAGYTVFLRELYFGMDLFSSLYPFVFCSLASGSNGNCYYIANGEEGILIDAGISMRSIRKRLGEIGVTINRIKAVFITHDHSDHIKGVAALTQLLEIPVYASHECIESVRNNPDCRDIRTGALTAIGEAAEKHVIGLAVEGFHVSHDAPGSMGYHIRNSHNSITLATDLGYISEKVAFYLKKATVVVLESNYDEEMLHKSRYPRFLRERVSGARGHLGNRQAAEFLAEHFTPYMSHIFLCHLSKENNHPDLAMNTLREKFSNRGIDTGETILRTLPRGARTEPFYF
jgi:phosphoribosyl 1,2-cyclic phosphodiesterase